MKSQDIAVLESNSAQVKSLVGQKRSPSEIADEMDVHRRAVYKFCEKHDLQLAGRQNYGRMTGNMIINRAEAMPPLAAVEFLCDFIRAFFPEHNEEVVNNFKARLPLLTPKEIQILVALSGRLDVIMTKEMLLTSLYMNSADEPEIKIIDVFVCKIRKKCPELQIDTIWGRGYRLTRKEGQVFPWEDAD